MFREDEEAKLQCQPLNRIGRAHEVERGLDRVNATVEEFPAIEVRRPFA
jgi:hypothetical protein